jgi:hypothetical protein
VYGHGQPAGNGLSSPPSSLRFFLSSSLGTFSHPQLLTHRHRRHPRLPVYDRRIDELTCRAPRLVPLPQATSPTSPRRLVRPLACQSTHPTMPSSPSFNNGSEWTSPTPALALPTSLLSTLTKPCPTPTTPVLTSTPSGVTEILLFPWRVRLHSRLIRSSSQLRCTCCCVGGTSPRLSSSGSCLHRVTPHFPD